MRRETKKRLENIIDIFCEQNDTSKVNVIVVDKDLTKIFTLRKDHTCSHSDLQFSRAIIFQK